MKNQALFSSKDKSKKLKCRLLQFLFGAVRVKKGIRDYMLGKDSSKEQMIIILFFYHKLMLCSFRVQATAVSSLQ